MRSLLLAALLLCARLSTAVAAAPERNAMTSQGFLKLADDGFFAPALSLLPALEDLVFSEFEGLALDAPGAVDLGARATLPIAALAVRRTAAAFDWTFGEHTVLVACEVDRFRCRAGAVAPPARPVVRPPPRPPPPGSQGKVGEQALVDARARLQLPWEPGTWQLVLVTRDVRSEAARVTLRRGPGAAAAAPAPLPGAALAVTTAGRGLDASIEVKLDVRASRAQLPPAPGGDAVAVPVTFVVIGHDRPAPRVAERPAAGRFVSGGGPERVAAALTTTLGELLPALPEGDAYYVWAFAGDRIGGPARIDLRRP